MKTPLTRWKKEHKLSYNEILQKVNSLSPKKRISAASLGNVFRGFARPSPTLAKTLMKLTGLDWFAVMNQEPKPKRLELNKQTIANLNTMDYRMDTEWFHCTIGCGDTREEC